LASAVVHHEDRGPRDAPPILLAGSLGTTLRIWDPQVEALTARGHRTIAYDQRGHGRSPAPDAGAPLTIAALGADALALLDHLGIARVTFVGLSLGGMVGQWVAAHAPDRVDRLVLLCTTAHLPPASAWQERAAAVRAAGSVRVVAEAVVARWVTDGYAAAHPETVAGLRAMLAAQPPDGYAACCEAIAAMDLRGDLGAIRAPTLVVAGAQDLAIPLEHQRRLAAGIADARLAIVEPGAHVVAVEQPAAVCDLITDHLDREPLRT
jgi:3-oxoadipate enol-lactonase